MSNNSWCQVLSVAETAGSALTNSTTATSLLPSSAVFTLPANILNIGTRIRVRAGGKISTAASSPGTLTLSTIFGSTAVFSTGASGTLVTSASNLTWVAEWHLTTLSIGGGTSATVLGLGVVNSFVFSATTPVFVVPSSSPAAGTGFASTSAQTVDFYGTWSVASSSNSITLLDYELALLN